MDRDIQRDLLVEQQHVGIREELEEQDDFEAAEAVKMRNASARNSVARSQSGVPAHERCCHFHAQPQVYVGG
eukprot:15463872-Alexandrium_andersonii.AAC.1